MLKILRLERYLQPAVLGSGSSKDQAQGIFRLASDDDFHRHPLPSNRERNGDFSP